MARRAGASRIAVEVRVVERRGSTPPSSTRRTAARRVDAAPRPAGRLRENRRDRNSARSADSSNSALYIRCTLQIAAPDVGDERDPRLERGDVGEVLIGPDAEVDAAGLHDALQLRDDDLERVLVRDEVVGAEVAVRLGEVVDQAPELGVGEARRAGRRATRRAPGAGAARQRERDDASDERARGAPHHRVILTIGRRRLDRQPQPRVSFMHRAEAVHEAAAAGRRRRPARSG